MIKRYFIVVLLLSLFPAGVSAQRRAAAKKDWKTKYDYVGAVHDGRILVHRGGEGSNPRMGRFYTDGCFGYTDTCGTVVFPLIYDYADSFSNGFAVVGKGEKNDRRFGLIDRQGREVVPCIYADVAGFSSGLARVQEGTDSVRRYGYVDTLGQVVIPLKYDYARDFSEGMAVVAKGEWSGKSGYGKRDFEFTGKYGFIDRRGNEVIAPIYDGAADFSEVLAAVGQMGKYYVRWGFVDAAGTLVIPCILLRYLCQNQSSSLTILRTGRTNVGDTDNSSIPICIKRSVNVVSAPSSPQIPAQIPSLCALSMTIWIIRSTAS